MADLSATSHFLQRDGIGCSLRFQKAVPAEEVLASIRAVDGVYLAEEL